MRISAVMVTVGLMALAAAVGAQHPVAPPAPAQWGVSAQPAPTAPWTPPQRAGAAPRTTLQQATTMQPHVLPLQVIPVLRGNPALIAELMGGYAVYDEGVAGGQTGVGGYGGYGGADYGGRTTGARDTQGRGYTDRGIGYSDPRTTRGTTTGRTTGLW